MLCKWRMTQITLVMLITLYVYNWYIPILAHAFDQFYVLGLKPLLLLLKILIESMYLPAPLKSMHSNYIHPGKQLEQFFAMNHISMNGFSAYQTSWLIINLWMAVTLENKMLDISSLKYLTSPPVITTITISGEARYANCNLHYR